MGVYDVTALGELLIDFTENGSSGQGNLLFEANPGGAPCNLLAMLQKMGDKTAFIGKVGKDMFGDMLKERAGSTGIDLSGLVQDPEINTTLAFVHTLPGGDREFSFYRKPGADMMLTAQDVEAHQDLIRQAKIFHFGTLSMTHDTVEQASIRAIEIAREAGCILSFDPNLRPPLWDSEEKAKEKIAYGFTKCDVLKISDNEIEFMTGKSDLEEGIYDLIRSYQIPLILATYGRDGSKAYYLPKDKRTGHASPDDYIKVFVDGFINPDTIETTGAGDTFGGCSLHYVLKYGLDGFDEEKLCELLIFANAAASIVTTRKGALCVMPEEKEVLSFIASRAG
ncbi:MAG: carbohydrate kinase [Eubacterium sp.]|nr:carbohydrate kinase [Eubacterium sp.]